MTATKRTLAEVRADEAARIDAELEVRLAKEAVDHSDELDCDFEQQELDAEAEDNGEVFYEFGKDIFFVGDQSVSDDE